MALLFFHGSATFLVICCTLSELFYTATVSAQMLKRFEDITGWALREENIYELSKARVKKLKEELYELEKFVEDYEKTTSQHLSGIKNPKLQELAKTDANVHAYVVASSAMLTYRMTHRLSTMIPRMQKVVLTVDPQGQELKSTLGTFMDVSQYPQGTLEPAGPMFGQFFDWLPTEDDLAGALDTMTVLYDVYNPNVLEPKDFAAKLSPETSSPVQVDAYHAAKFSLKAFYHGYYGNAIDWAKYAINKLETERDYSITKEFVDYMLSFMVTSHNEEMGKSPDDFPETISYLNFFTELANETEFGRKRKSNMEQLHEIDEKERQFVLLNSHYYTVCQNALLQMMTNDFKGIPSRLTCTLNRRINPYFYLAPLKVETISESPRILQFYDVISPMELEKVMGEVRLLSFESSYPLKEFPDELGTRKPHLRMAMDVSLDKQTLSLEQNARISSLVKKWERLMGIKLMENKEQYSDGGIKTSEYVVGGYEALQKLNKNKEAKFRGGVQLFLQAPEEGGEVVFGGEATFNKFVKPVRGSLLFWENIGSDRNVPMDILLGSCPVVQGHKIVVSKNFYYNFDQIPC